MAGFEVIIEENSAIDVVFGRRPSNNSGMAPGRKEIEEFEQYLLFRHRVTELKQTFADYDIDQRLLPDGQAGCWAFRLSAARRLPLTASGYEIEFDLLTSALDAGLKAAYTEPLLMSDEPRHSSASAAVIEMSLKKLNFIERKLQISRGEIEEDWRDFTRHFASSPLLKAIHPSYEQALLAHCAGTSSPNA